MKSKNPIILFDDKCSLCTRFKDGLKYLDKNHTLQFTPLSQAEEIYQRYPQLNEKECHETVHLIDENDKILRGPEVVEYLIKFYPQVSKLAWLVETDVGKKAVKFFYDKVNELKQSKISPCSECKK